MCCMLLSIPPIRSPSRRTICIFQEYVNQGFSSKRMYCVSHLIVMGGCRHGYTQGNDTSRCQCRCRWYKYGYRHPSPRHRCKLWIKPSMVVLQFCNKNKWLLPVLFTLPKRYFCHYIYEVTLWTQTPLMCSHLSYELSSHTVTGLKISSYLCSPGSLPWGVHSTGH